MISKSWKCFILIEVVLVVTCSAQFASSFSMPPCHSASTITSVRENRNPSNKSGVRNSKGAHSLSSPHSARRTALNISGGAIAPAIEAVGALGVLGEISTWYRTYPLISSVVTCAVKGCLADLIAQRKNRIGEDGSILDRPPPFSFRRNLAYIVYGAINLGLMCEVMYNHAYPFLFKNTAGMAKLMTTVAFDNFVTAPLLWLPPVYFVKAVLFGQSLSSGGHKYIDDVRNEGLLTAYWKVWIPAQIINFWKVPAHLRVAFMAGTSFFWLIILSCLSSNKKQ